MKGRIYSPKLGRMLSPAPVTQAPGNGQNYNRYAYAFNNPLIYTDPSGYKLFWTFSVSWGGAGNSSGSDSGGRLGACALRDVVMVVIPGKILVLLEVVGLF